jgi:hypothetical protein
MAERIGSIFAVIDITTTSNCASQSHCPRHRKRGSQHCVSGYRTSVASFLATMGQGMHSNSQFLKSTPMHESRVWGGRRGLRMNVRERSIAKSQRIHTYTELRQQIHDDLLIQHPEWVEPNGQSPMCDFYEARLMELLHSDAKGLN